MRWLFQGIVILWLLLLAFWGGLIQFNKYGDLTIIDCDTDAEAVFTIVVTLMWLTTLLIWAVNLILKSWTKLSPLWFLGSLSLTLAMVFIPKLLGLISYNSEINQFCSS